MKEMKSNEVKVGFCNLGFVDPMVVMALQGGIIGLGGFNGK